jgi:hypothetical protein
MNHIPHRLMAAPVGFWPSAVQKLGKIDGGDVAANDYYG